MIKVINQEEFEKCLSMLDSKDSESHLLGINLLRTCVNCSNLKVKLIYKHVNGEMNWDELVSFENLFPLIESSHYGWKDFNAQIKWSDYVYILFTNGCFIFPSGVTQHELINL